jgi:mono/diheme cytochrome c family protein
VSRIASAMLAFSVACGVYAFATPPKYVVAAYGAGYVGEPADDRIARLEKKVDRILAILEAAAKDAPPAQPQKAESDFAAGVKACAKCHTEGASPKGRFALFGKDRQLAELSDEDHARMTKALTAKTMPPEGVQFSDAQRAAILKGYDPK